MPAVASTAGERSGSVLRLRAAGNTLSVLHQALLVKELVAGLALEDSFALVVRAVTAPMIVDAAGILGRFEFHSLGEPEVVYHSLSKARHGSFHVD